MTHNHQTLSRRTTILGLTAAWALGGSSLAVAQTALPADRRFVVILLRGGMDGLAVVAPYGDPALRLLRPKLALPDPSAADGLQDLGGFFGLHPALSHLGDLYRQGDMLVAHAVASPYRSRSHFEAQDLLELGAADASIARPASGWLARTLAEISQTRAIAMGMAPSLLLLGGRNVTTHGFSPLAVPHEDFYARVSALHQHDPLTGPALTAAFRGRRSEQEASARRTEPAERDRGSFPALARLAGELLATPDGARIAALELGGWDTHASQELRLPLALRQLDAGILALKDGLKDHWQRTTILVMSEFGRTARENGTSGTDHGTAGAALLIGGAVAGGRVIGTWPGLSPEKLFEGRDLAPTTDIRSLAIAVLRTQLGLTPPATERIFPGTRNDSGLAGLFRA